MESDCYKDWISLFDDDLKNTWINERRELRRISMIFQALDKELTRTRKCIHEEIDQLKSDLKRKELLRKCQKFEGLVQSERIDLTPKNKENLLSPKKIPFQEQDLNDLTTELFIESPNTSKFFDNAPKTPEIGDDAILSNETSPSMNKSSHYYKRLNSPSPSLLLYPVITHKVKKTPKREEKKVVLPPAATPKRLNMSDVVDCSIIDNTPEIELTKKGKNKSKSSLIISKHRPKNKTQTNKNNTLTQMFSQPKKKQKIEERPAVSSNGPSMDIDEVLDFINYSSDETMVSSPPNSKPPDDILDQNIGATSNLVDVKSEDSKDAFDLSSEFIKNYNKLPEKKASSPKNTVVRGKERKKMKGWACKECENWYAGMNLPPDELQKKIDECSKHRNNHNPREETYPGFWGFSFGPTPPAQKPERPLGVYPRK